MVVGVPIPVHSLWPNGEIVRVGTSPELIDPVRARERQDHVWGRNLLGILDVVVLPLGQHRGGEWHPEVSILDHVIDGANHVRPRGVREDRSVPEGAGTEFHSPLAPCYDLTFNE